MFYTKYDPPSTLWYIYNSNRKDGGAFGSYRKKEEADKEDIEESDKEDKEEVAEAFATE